MNGRIIQKKHNLVYKITNLLDNKIYIGVHKTNNLNDKYLGSGKLIKEDIKLKGKKNFKKEILFDFNTYKEALNKEKEIVDKEFLKRKDIYNLVPGGSTGYLSININKTVVRNKKGKVFQVSINDPRYLNGKLVGHTKGKIVVIDKNGKTFQTDKNDPRYLNGELVGATKGYKVSKETKVKLSISGKKRYKTEIHCHTGKTCINNGKKFKFIFKDEKIPKGWKLGNLPTINGRFWINNGLISKYCDKNLNIPKGWKKGRFSRKKIK